MINEHKIKIVLIEDSLDICKTVKRYFDHNVYFQIVGIAHDGEDGFELLQRTPCDIALIDIIMPRKDGISVLEALHENPEIRKPACIMLTAVSHDGLTKKALELGADYFMLKPFDLDMLARRMMDIYNHRKEQVPHAPEREPDESPVNFAAEQLRRIGVPSNLNGYTYLKSAVTLSIADPAMLSGITKILYPKIAKDCSTTAVRVERSIRHAIQVSWENRNEEAYAEYVGYISAKHEKPTNSHLISLMVEKYRIQTTS